MHGTFNSWYAKNLRLKSTRTSSLRTGSALEWRWTSFLNLSCIAFFCVVVFLLRVTSAKNVGTHANRGCFLDVSSPLQRLPENEERRGDVCHRRDREGGDLDRTSGVNAIHVSHRIFRSDRRLSRVHESSRSGTRQHAPPQRRVGFAPHLSTVTRDGCFQLVFPLHSGPLPPAPLLVLRLRVRLLWLRHAFRCSCPADPPSSTTPPRTPCSDAHKCTAAHELEMQEPLLQREMQEPLLLLFSPGLAMQEPLLPLPPKEAKRCEHRCAF